MYVSLTSCFVCRIAHHFICSLYVRKMYCFLSVHYCVCCGAFLEKTILWIGKQFDFVLQRCKTKILFHLSIKVSATLSRTHLSSSSFSPANTLRMKLEQAMDLLADYYKRLAAEKRDEYPFKNDPSRNPLIKKWKQKIKSLEDALLNVVQTCSE